MEIDRLSALPDELVLSIVGDLYQHDMKEAAKTATLSKRWRFMCRKLVDRLSELPDELLVHILRRLDDTDEAAKTATLSKRWRFIWTKLPKIKLWSRSSENEEIGTCFARIREALAAYGNRKGASLEYRCRLRLSLYYDDAFADDLVALLDSAENSGVRDVDLNVRAAKHYRYPSLYSCALPQALYSYPSLRKLYLCGLNLVPPATTVQWGLMIELSLSFVSLPQQALDQIVSGCPLLIRLKVRGCSGFNRLDVRGQRFRELDLDDMFGSPELLEISAPYMTSLKLCIDPNRRSLRLTDVSSVEQVDIYFSFLDEYKETEMFSNNKQLFELLQRVTSLVLKDEFIQVLSNTRRENGGQLPQFRVQELTIKDDTTNTNNIADVLAILESSPFLDKLVIHDTYCSKNKDMNWNPSVGAADLVCDLLHLKTVEILIYVEIPHQLYLTLAQILLRRAPVLEEMVIKVEYNESEPEDGIELVKKFETLLTFPKSSHKAVVHTICIL